MGKKRKQDVDSSSSDAKRCRSCHCQSGETSRPNDGMPPRAIIELKDVMQLQLRMEEKFKRKIQKLKEKRKKDKKKHEEDLRVLKEELESKIQEMQKEECAEVNHYKASPSQRSQLSQSTRFQLVIENSVKSPIYKNRTVQTEDGGGHIKVVMYDDDDPIASDHDLASVKVELVLIEGVFDEKRDSWSKEEFKESIIKPQRTTTLTSLVKNGTFDLSDGRRDYKGAIIMDNSKKKEVKLGVRIAGHTKIRVLEGVSNPFKVQEGKTERNNRLSYPLVEGNGTAEDNRLSYPPATVPLGVEGNGQALNGNSQQFSQQIPTPILWQSTSTHSMQHEQGCSLPPPSMQNPLQVAGNYTVNHHLLASGQDQYNNFPNASSPLAFLNNHLLNNIPQWNPIPREEIFVEGVNHSNIQPPVEEYCKFKLEADTTCFQLK